MKIAVVLLTWQRINNLKTTLNSLSRQTHKDFFVYISNANKEKARSVEKYVSYFRENKNLNVKVSHDSNDKFAFRRLDIGEKLAKQGVDVILFIDDDVTIPDNYIKQFLENYESNTYSSAFAWSFQDGGSDYYKKRTRVTDLKEKVNYCGTAVSMIDASIFLNRDIHKAPEEMYVVEDLWLSYYAQQILNWKLKYVYIPGIRIKGGDAVALYRKVANSEKNKADLLRILVNDYGWKL